MKKILPVLILLAILAGCSRQEAPPSERPPAPKTTLRIGLIPEQNIFKQMERYGPLARYLSKKTGTNIELRVLSRYGNIIDNFKSEKLDGAFFGSFTYALAHSRIGVEVVARPVNLDNTSTYHGYIFVRKDSGIRSAGDMKGKRFAFVDKATTAGYLLPLEYFEEQGIGNYKKYFGETYFSGTHEASINDVLDRKTDVGAAKNTIFDRLARTDPRVSRDLVILARSPDVPENGLALRGDLDASLRHGIREALLGMEADPEGREVLKRFGAIRFIETRTEDYAAVYKYAKRIRLDLATYDYLND